MMGSRMVAQSIVKKANLSKVVEASRTAMKSGVSVAVEIDEVMTLSLHRKQDKRKIELFESRYEFVGRFAGSGNLCREDLFLMIWEELEYAGALLPERPAGARLTLLLQAPGRGS